jgi:hypothetical protein
MLPVMAASISLISGIRRTREQSGSRHHLARLAVAALRGRLFPATPLEPDECHPPRDPSSVTIGASAAVETGRQAGTDRPSAKVHRARAALADAAAKFCALQIEHIAQAPTAEACPPGTSTVAVWPFTFNLYAILSTPEKEEDCVARKCYPPCNGSFEAA